MNKYLVRLQLLSLLFYVALVYFELSVIRYVLGTTHPLTLFKETPLSICAPLSYL